VVSPVLSFGGTAIDLLGFCIHAHLIETARPVMEAMVQKVIGVKALTLHHDVSTVTGEEMVAFTLAESPGFREAKKR